MSTYLHNVAVEDPGSVPLRDAATVMVLADRPELEVLMVQRTARMAFGANVWVFPGGRVDADDLGATDGIVRNLSDPEASARLGVASGGLAWWLAGIRETLEEAGLLLACDACDHVQLEEVRAAADSDNDHFVRALADHGLHLDLASLAEVGRFITPLGPPRRFDTRFFVAPAPVDQEVIADPSEVADARWIRPADAIEQWENNRFPLMSVTHRMLASLASYESADAVLEKARMRPARQRVRVQEVGDHYSLLLPGESGYEDGSLDVEQGWVRL